MRQRLYDYLFQHPGGATSDELLHHLFPTDLRGRSTPSHSPEFSARIVNTAIGADSHFSYDSATDRWHVKAHTLFHQAASDATFTILDLETTGLKPGAAGITEIAAVRVENGCLTSEFHSLLNPGRRIPFAITQLTGITEDMVRNQPSIDAMFPQFLDFLGPAVLVAHNADFDLGFLNFEARRLASSPLLNPALCTLRLARRLLPVLRSRSLDALASHFGVANQTHHRALEDARVTAEILLILLEQAAALGFRSLGEVLDFQHSARDGRRFEVFVPRPFLHGLPEVPGVYRMLDGEGHLLYIGKAKNLRRRISSYFANSSGHSDKVLDLVRTVREVTYEQTGSELEAALREATLIRTLKPPYNTLSKHLPRVAFLKLTRAHSYPRLAVTAKPGTDRSFYIGPFRSREFAEQAHRLLARLFGLRTCQGSLAPDPSFTPCLSGQVGACTAPCHAAVTQEAYAEQVNAFLRFLNGEDLTLRESIIEKRDRLAAELRFEGAARLQHELQLLDQIVHVHNRLHWIVTRAHALVLLPSHEPGAAQAYLILNGRLIVGERVRTRPDLERFSSVAHEHFHTDQDRPLRPEEIDASVILAAWLRDPNREQGAVFPIKEPSTLENQLDEIEIALSDLRRIEYATSGD
ncbi:MAG: GIY-YIG nuclease family protein [Deltaproteobacteria bacterium]|nr:GIY-YIG nuclease family protein [Deltaproteobacteria bacterium]